jgi:lipooligosaccharide transport system permease protein
MSTVLDWEPARRPRVGALRVLERNLLVYRRLWLVLVSGFVEPVAYLAVIGFGLGGLVGPQVLPGGRAVSYAAFVAPALLGACVMSGVVFDSTQNFFWKLRYSGVYDGMLATSLGGGSVLLGEAAWSVLRGTLYGAAFLAVAVALGLVGLPGALLALAVVPLAGAAFAAPAMAATTYARTWQDTAYFQLATLPMFLLSTTFYPLSVVPAPARPLLWLSPLYHAVALLRGLALGGPSGGLWAHAACLAALALGGAWVCARRFDRLRRS